MAQTNHQSRSYCIDHQYQMYAGVASHPYTIEVVGTQLVRHTNRCSGTNAQDHHKGHIAYLIGYLMCSQCLFADPADKHKGGGKGDRFHQGLNADGKTDLA